MSPFAISPGTGLSDKPVRWRSVDVNSLGQITLPDMPGSGTVRSTYLCSCLFSPTERTVILEYHGGPLRLWINHQLVPTERTEGIAELPWYEGLRIPVALKAGLNHVLLKTDAASCQLQLRDSSADQALFLAEQCRFTEAATLMDRNIDQTLARLDSEFTFRSVMSCFPLALMHDSGSYHRVCAELPRKLDSTQDQGMKGWATWLAALRPNAVFDANAAKFVEAAEAWATSGPVYEDLPLVAAMANYRAGKITEAKAWAERTLSHSARLPILALISHQSGDSELARTYLNKSRETLQSMLAAVLDVHRSGRRKESELGWWYAYLWTEVLLLEAEQQIAPGGPTSRQYFLSAEKELAEFWSKSPETFAFDQAEYIMWSEGRWYARPYIARAQHLAQLGRIPEAEADFNRAVELAPKDSEVLLARCLYRADSGQIELAADDAWTIVAPGFGDQWYATGRQIERQIAYHQPVLDELYRRHPNRADLHRYMGEAYLWKGRWQEAREAFSTGDPYWSLELAAAYLSALLNDPQGVLEAVERSSRLMQTQGVPESDHLRYRAQALALVAMPQSEAEQLVLELTASNERWNGSRAIQWSLALAQLRAGSYREAIRNLNAAKVVNHLPAAASSWAALAIAHWKLGEQESARGCLQRSELVVSTLLANSKGSRTCGGEVFGNLDWKMGLVLHREARTLIDGPEAAEAEFAALFSPPKQDDTPQLSQQNRLETYWNKAVDAAGNDPLPLIQRGRWYLECGEKEKAEADFAKAAAMTPHELNKFLEAGWWVAGPYPGELKQFCPPEIDPDPSKPVHIIGPATGLSEEPVPWRSITTGKWGRVNLADRAIGKEGSSLYGLGCIFSPDERATILMVGRNDRLRVFLNGQLLEDYEPDGMAALPQYEQYHRIPVVLKPGKNQLLVKTTAPAFTVRVADSPRDQVVLLAEQRRFSEAVRTLERVDVRDRFEVTGGVLPHAIMFLLGSERHQWYADGCRVEFDWSQTQTADAKHVVAALCALQPNAVFTQHQEQMLKHAEDYLQLSSGGWSLSNAALVNYRAGNYARAGALLSQVGWNHYTLPMNALLQHHAGEKTLAEKFLNEALTTATTFLDSTEHCDRSSFDEAPTPFHWWHDWGNFLTMLGEAEQAIHQETTQTEALRQRSEIIHKQLWEKSSEVAPFDLVLLHQCRDGSGVLKFPTPGSVSRGKRYLELGRLDEAERDFNKALELKSNDRDLLVDRARLHARRGDAAKAAADLDAARKISIDQSVTPGGWQSVVDLEFLQLPEIGLQIASQLQERPGLLFCELLVRLDRNDVDGVRQLISRLRPMGPIGRTHAGAGAILIGDRELYEEICAEAVQSKEDPAQLILLLQMGMPQCISPEDLLKQIEDLYPKFTGNPLAAPALGLARFRAGKYELALQMLEPAAKKASPWQDAALAWPALAMTYYRLQRTDEAKKVFDRTEQWLAMHRETNQYRQQTFGDHNTGIGEYVIVLLLQREAKAILEQPGLPQ